jgi:hypothetical protein
MAGMTYRANSSVDWFAEYRMLKADSLQLETTGVNTSLPNGSGGFNYESGTVLSGLRFKF